jgi:SNF2 family DNA or RNA helicase
VEYHGAVNAGDRVNAIQKFQGDKGIKWFVASKAACRGLTLTAAEQGFFYTNNFDLMIRLQAEDRNHRIGSEIHEHILYTDIWTTGVDKRIVTSMREKKALADQITRDPRELFME